MEVFSLKKIVKIIVWSLKFEKCVNCGTNEIKHRAQGLCIKCYSIKNENKQRSDNRVKGKASAMASYEYLYNEYVKNEKSLRDIAVECGCTRQYIYKVMKLHGIKVRDKSSARVFALKKDKIGFNVTYRDGHTESVILQKQEVDEQFFTAWSNKLAYVLGVIYTDGNLFFDEKRKLATITISQKAPEILEKIKQLIKCNAKLIYIPRKTHKSGVVSGELYRLQFRSHKVYNSLLDFGLFPDKSLKIEFPSMPREHIRHFIRGCWDGDGSVYIEKRNNSIAASFVSGSFNFIKGILQHLEMAGLPSITIHTRKGKNPSYYFRFRGSACLQLYNYLYDDVPSEQYLSRKNEIFFNYFQPIIELEKTRN